MKPHEIHNAKLDKKHKHRQLTALVKQIDDLGLTLREVELWMWANRLMLKRRREPELRYSSLLDYVNATWEAKRDDPKDFVNDEFWDLHDLLMKVGPPRVPKW